MALPIAYGSRKCFKALYHLSIEYNSIINDDNENFFRYLFHINYIFLFNFFYFTWILQVQKYHLKLWQFFIAGASIYVVGTFIIGANADYN